MVYYEKKYKNNAIHMKSNAPTVINLLIENNNEDRYLMSLIIDCRRVIFGFQRY